MANVTVTVTAPSAKMKSWAESQGWDGVTGTAKAYLDEKLLRAIDTTHVRMVGENAARVARENAIKDL